MAVQPNLRPLKISGNVVDPSIPIPIDKVEHPPHHSLLNYGFAEEIPALISDATYTWRTGDDGTELMLRATDKGLAAIGDGAAPTDEPATIEAFTQDVLGFLVQEGCNATILEEAEARTMVEDGFVNSRPAARVTGDIDLPCFFGPRST